MILLTNGELAKITNVYYSFDSSETIEEAIDVADEEGYMKNANANDNITREEVCAIVCRLTKMDTNSEPLSFIDASDVSAWAIPYVSAMEKSGIVIGYTDNTFKPKKFLTKAEFIVMLSRIEGAGGADDNIELIFEESNDLEIGIINNSGDDLYITPINDEMSLKIGNRVLLSIALPEDKHEELIVGDYDSSLIKYDEELSILSAISSGDTEITFKTEDNKYVKKIKINIY